MGKYRYLLWIFMGFMLLHCDAPYQPYASFRGGYVDQELSRNLFSVSFYGNAYTTLGVAKKYAKKRAEEVCVQKGSAKYKLVDSKERLASYVLNSEITCFTMKGKHLCKDHGYYIQKPIVTIDFICMESKFST